MTETGESQPMDRKYELPIALSIAGWVGASLLLTSGIFTVVAFMQGGGNWPTTETDPDWIRTVTLSTLPTAGVLAGAAAVALTVRRQRTADNNYRLSVQQLLHIQSEASKENSRAASQIDRDQIAGLRDRFTTAAAQLGDASPQIQLAGIYALAALADDWLERENRVETQTCINLLCAFLRNSEDSSTRSAIVELIARRLLPKNAHNPSWSRFTFNLDSLHISDDEALKFRDCVIDAGTVLSFSRMTLSGGVLDCARVHLNGGEINFYNSHFESGHLTFSGSFLDSGRLNLDKCTFGTNMHTTIRPRTLHRGVVSARSTVGVGPTVVVPQDEEAIRANRQANREAGKEGSPKTAE